MKFRVAFRRDNAYDVGLKFDFPVFDEATAFVAYALSGDNDGAGVVIEKVEEDADE